MEKVHLVSRKGFDPKKWHRQKPSDADTSKEFSRPGIYCVDGKPAIIYGQLVDPHEKMLWAVRSIGFRQEVRSSNINRFGGKMSKIAKEQGLGESRIFGFRPRVPFAPAANFCSISSSALDTPVQHDTICHFGRLLNSIYETAAPGVAARHSELLKETRAEWILPGTRFTSGIVNKNNPLKYHFDRGNLEDVMSCMVVFRNLCEGGSLSVPELDARWLLSDRSYFLFDGQRFLHGVTQIKKLNKSSYRYSVVYYALRAMAKCGTLDEEISRARREKRAREKRRV